jgi:hypothetical protein
MRNGTGNAFCFKLGSSCRLDRLDTQLNRNSAHADCVTCR